MPQPAVSGDSDRVGNGAAEGTRTLDIQLGKLECASCKSIQCKGLVDVSQPVGAPVGAKVGANARVPLSTAAQGLLLASSALPLAEQRQLYECLGDALGATRVTAGRTSEANDLDDPPYKQPNP